MFVHGGVLYSLANQVLVPDHRFYHVEDDGSVAKNAFPMAQFVDSEYGKVLIVSCDWDARFMTVNEHFKTLFAAAEGVERFWTRWIGDDNSRAADLEAQVSNIRHWMNKAARARFYSNDYHHTARNLATQAIRYSSLFGLPCPLLCSRFVGSSQFAELTSKEELLRMADETEWARATVAAEQSR
jgi:hypothetical protein